MATLVAGPVLAQLLPTVSILYGPTDGTTLNENLTENRGCIEGFDVVFSQNTTQDTTFRILISRLSGHDYFRNHGMLAFYSPDANPNDLSPTIRTFTMPSGTGTGGLDGG